MKPKSEAELEMLRKIYPQGTVVILENMDDRQAPPSGTHGKVQCIDSIGQIHVKWANGSTLALIPGVDSFRTTNLVMFENEEEDQ